MKEEDDYDPDRDNNTDDPWIYPPHVSEDGDNEGKDDEDGRADDGSGVMAAVVRGVKSFLRHSFEQAREALIRLGDDLKGNDTDLLSYPR